MSRKVDDGSDTDPERWNMKHTVDQYLRACGCRGLAECNHNWFVEETALEACVDVFAAELKKRLLHHCKRNFKSGWDDPDWPREEIIKRLKQNADEGDMIDVAAMAMFAWNQES